MKFYKELSSVYDLVFPEDKETTQFLTQRLQENSRVLDLACGTGSYTAAISAIGHEAIGIDLDQDMIKIALEKTNNDKLSFFAGNMLNIDKWFGDTGFNLIYCIGNSLVHLPDKEDISTLIHKTYKLLEPKGELVIQIINYDRILKYNIKSLPTIEKDEGNIKFIRSYRLSEDLKTVHFDTELHLLKNGKEEKYYNSVPLIPLTSKEVLELAAKAGFKKIGLHGDFTDDAFTEDSYLLVLRAIKL